MTEDFIIEEEGESPSNRRPFLIAVGILLTILVLAVICSATLLITKGSGADDERAAEIASIETQNAVVAVTNAAVTQTLIAMETEAARPTDTPAAPPTNTPQPTNTLRPTNTPVVQQAEDEEATPGAAATDAASQDGLNTPTPISALDSGSGGGSADSSNGDALPQTGIETWGALVAAFVLIGVFLAARRLRSS